MMALMFGSVYQVNKSNIRQQEQQIVSDLKTNPEYQGRNIDVKLKLENRNRTPQRQVLQRHSPYEISQGLFAS